MSCGSTNPRQWVSRRYESLLTIILEIIWHTKNMLLKRSFKMKRKMARKKTSAPGLMSIADSQLPSLVPRE